MFVWFVIGLIVGLAIGVTAGWYCAKHEPRSDTPREITDAFGGKWELVSYSVHGAVVKCGCVRNAWSWAKMVRGFPEHKAEFEAIREAYSQEVSK